MAGHEVGVVDEVGGPDRLRAEAQVRDRHRSRLLGVVDEVALGEEVGLLADDLHRRLVRADGAVGSEAEEHRLHLTRRPVVADLAVGVDGEAGDIVEDADRDVRAWAFGRQLAEDAANVARQELLRRQAVPSPDDPGHPARERQGAAGVRLDEGGDDIEVQRLADRPGLLGAIEHRDARDSGGKCVEQCRGRKWAVEPHDQEANLLAAGGQRLHRFGCGTRRRSHQHDDPLGVGRADVVDETVAATRAGGQFVEDLDDDAGDCLVVEVGRLARLEEDVRVLGGAAQCGCIGRHAAHPMSEDVVVTHQRGEIVVVDDADLVDLVARAEPVEEVQERHPGPQRRGVRHEREVVRLLHRSRRQHRPARGAGVHHVGVVTEDRQGMGRDRAGGHVDDARCQFPGDLEHVRDHQQQPLARCERGRHRTLLQRAVQRPRGPRLRLHLDDLGNQPPAVRPPGRRPIVGVLTHWRRRCDRIDRDHLAQRVGDARGCLISVDACLLSLHGWSSFRIRRIPSDRTANEPRRVGPKVLFASTSAADGSAR